MPSPIKPVHKLDLHEELFDIPYSNEGLSSIQMKLLGVSSDRQATASKLSEKYVNLLAKIDKNVDEVITAAGYLSNVKNGESVEHMDKVCSVPHDISDNDLFALKTAGLVKGHGRSVTLTDSGRIALRDHYLNTPVNEFRKNRTKNKFDYNEAATVKVASKSKYKKC
jgi:hypothetical protein